MADLKVGVTFPGEMIGTQALVILEKLIDGQTPDQKKIIWDQWIAFWKPVVERMIEIVNPKVDSNAKVG